MFNWRSLALTRSIALVPALFVALATQSWPRISDDVDQWLNILQCVQLPFALLPVLNFTSQGKLMGEQNKNGACYQLQSYLQVRCTLTCRLRQLSVPHWTALDCTALHAQARR